MKFDDDQSSDELVEEASTEIELISLDHPKSLIEQRDEIRPDSPLGILDVMCNDEPSSSNHLIGPLPPLSNLIDPQPVPKLQPPNGWVNKIKISGKYLGNALSLKIIYCFSFHNRDF